jgi:sterol desaturase/sphingolipid hydroxylase (fatty acid hydroxylase superfamily)
MPKNPLLLIQSMVAPAVMISACGLLLLSLTNKLGRIIDRIRDLNTEDRSAGPNEEPVRRMSIRNQIDQLVERAVLLRRSCGLLFLGVTFFVATSLCIGLSNLTVVFEYLMIISFVIGLVIVVWAGILAYWEMRISHQVIIEEIKELRLRE